MFTDTKGKSLQYSIKWVGNEGWSIRSPKIELLKVMPLIRLYTGNVCAWDGFLDVKGMMPML